MLNFIYEDVYDAIPTVVTTFVAIIAKISIFIFLLELVHYLSKSSFNYVWVNNLLISSLLSLVIGTVLGLNQSRIKRLYAYSTISHVGFILLGLSIHSVESIQAFMFYIVQYSFSNLNAFILLITIGYTYYNYTYKYDISDHNLNKTQPESAPQNNKEKTQLPEFGLKDKDNSPIQLISQLKGYYNINPLLALSLSITLFSFAGIPPLVGFFGKMMILSAAIDSGYIFMALIAILTSVISAVYYLYIINIIYFEKSEYTLFKNLNNMNFKGSIANIYFTGEDTDKKNGITQESIPYPSLSASLRVGHDEIKLNYNNVVLSNYLTITISILTLIILLFIFIPTELLNISSILVLILFKI